MNVLIVSGIWPPDVGGPASHAPAVAEYLLGRGHLVEVLTTAETAPAPERYPVRWVSRTLPVGIRHLRAVLEIRERSALADVVYTTGMFGRSAAGSLAARKPFVLKLTADPAFERARRRGLVEGDVGAFQATGGGLTAGVLRLARDTELKRAAHVFCPSAWLRELAISWGVSAERVSVLPNPAPIVDGLAGKEELRSALGLEGPTLAFAGRLTAQKALGVSLEAVAQVDGVSLVLAGDGPDREALEHRAAELGLGQRVRFLGALPRERVLELFRAADAAILSSDWENFPHTVVEALAVGTPVVATAVGGVPEVVCDGANGLLVPARDTSALAGAVRRLFADAVLRARLTAAAAPSVAAYAPDRLLVRVEEALVQAACS